MAQHNYLVWNEWFNVDWLFPQLPHQSKMPAEAQFHPSTNYGFRPINSGQGGSGKEFSESIGGNLPREQFTSKLETFMVYQTNVRWVDCSVLYCRSFALAYS